MNEIEHNLFLEIVRELGANYDNAHDSEEVLRTLIKEMITNALQISNRKQTDSNINLLKTDIKKAAKTIYLQRGVEDTAQRTEKGLNSVFTDALDEMRSNIVKSGKRVVF